ncbi:MAG: hypothetical protein IJ124_05150 [Clostridia bacterium]|nr:hypothetical protein [Clostridia bacterium]MBQ8708108.1 hypothetical protein [Succinivibrionaceae bacterium]MBQ8708154.1 hypothetical protein [Succinivibrionaceae bacterium]
MERDNVIRELQALICLYRLGGEVVSDKARGEAIEALEVAVSILEGLGNNE